MNETLKNLAVQAGWDNHHAQFDTRVEKYAEILLFECIKLAVFKGDTATAAAIKEHFGVEE